jgi:toxin CcdB
MAQFDVFRLPDGELVVDCQTDLLFGLGTRLVVPLQAMEEGGQISTRLNPIFVVAGKRLVFKAHLAAAVNIRLLRQPMASLAEQEYIIKAALDVLISGI